MRSVRSYQQNMFLGALGLLLLLAWVGVAWTFWQAHSVRPRQTLSHEKAIVLDAETAQEYARLSGFQSPIHFVDETTMAALSETGNAIQLWDLPPCTALHPFIAWVCLGATLIFTAAWCYYLWQRYSS